MRFVTIKRRITTDDGDITVNALTAGIRYQKDRHPYIRYFDCTKCPKASWYDDDYCNNQKIHFVDREGVYTTRVYCENFRVIKDGE